MEETAWSLLFYACVARVCIHCKKLVDSLGSKEARYMPIKRASRSPQRNIFQTKMPGLSLPLSSLPLSLFFLSLFLSLSFLRAQRALISYLSYSIMNFSARREVRDGELLKRKYSFVPCINNRRPFIFPFT